MDRRAFFGALDGGAALPTPTAERTLQVTQPACPQCLRYVYKRPASVAEEARAVRPGEHDVECGYCGWRGKARWYL